MKKVRLTKEQVLKACEGSMGVLAPIYKKLGISRSAFYWYRKRYPEVEKFIQDELNRGLDYAESKLLELISEKDFRAISFYLERKGKDRGWGQQQISVTGSPVQPIICFSNGKTNVEVVKDADGQQTEQPAIEQKQD